MTRRPIAMAVVLVGTFVAGGIAASAAGGGSTPPPTPTPSPVSLAHVVRTDLTMTVLTAGALGYAPSAPVVNKLPGTYTALPPSGTTIHSGETLYRVDDRPVVLWAGATPAWRNFALGMPDGPDVAELEANLINFGFATNLFAVTSNHFSSLTAVAVERWQAASGYGADGTIALGQIDFLPGPVRVGAEGVAPGQTASPGDVPYQVTSTTRVVTVPLNPSVPDVHLGERVSIVLPTNATTPGLITAIGPAPPTNPSASTGSSMGGGGSNGSGQTPAAALITVTPDQPTATGTGSGIDVQVSLVTQSAVGVLAVPIPALLALAGGGYGVEVVDRARLHHLVGVTTGVFTGTQVEVSGPGINAGTTVVVAQ